MSIAWIIIHLGINPVKGGKPPKDKSEKGRVNDRNKVELLGAIKSEIQKDWKV